MRINRNFFKIEYNNVVGIMVYNLKKGLEYMKILEISQLEKIYEGSVSYEALKQINFTVEDGEFTAIMGPSGSGKSTLLNVISTVDKPTSGYILINDKNPHMLKDKELAAFRRTELGFVFQDFNLIHTLTVAENIMLPLTLEGIGKKEMEKRTKEIAKLLGIEDLLSKRTFEISGGQAQRTAICRAVIHNPSLLLADEPTGNLDSKSAKDVMSVFNKLNQRGSTILMVTHDAYVASFCQRVLFIKDGKLYHEIHSDGNQRKFHQSILDMMTFLGGEQRDLI